MSVLYLDLETYSPRSIRDGVFVYSEAGVEIILTAYAIDDEPAVVVEGQDPNLQSMIDNAERVVVHNAIFERTVLRYCGVNLPIEKTVCTMALSRLHGLPGGLLLAGRLLGLQNDMLKTEIDLRLMRMFCTGRKRADPAEHPEDWKAFTEYARQDVEAMRALYRSMPTFNTANNFEREVWMAEQRINDRGFLVDLDTVARVIEETNERKNVLDARTSELSGGEISSARQRNALLAFLKREYELPIADLTKTTLNQMLQDEDLPDIVKELISVRLESALSSVSKYKTLSGSAGSDGRVRDTLVYCGASRTGRWAGRRFQPQNLPRPKLSASEIETCIEAFRDGSISLLMPPGEAARDCIRGMVIAPPGKVLVMSDYANIESRVLAWLAGEEQKVEDFRQADAGLTKDIYTLSYSRVFGVPIEQVTSEQRQIGKVMELALGYQGSVGAFSSMASLYGVSLSDRQVLDVVNRWRQANPNIVGFWRSVEAAAVRAAYNPGKIVRLGFLAFARAGSWLVIRLPSGRCLCYPKIEVAEAAGRYYIEYSQLNNYSKAWSPVYTYGGKLVENIVQATARDVLAHAIVMLDRANIPVVLHVHDEVVCEIEPLQVAEVESIMNTVPGWATGLPIRAGTHCAERYGK